MDDDVSLPLPTGPQEPDSEDKQPSEDKTDEKEKNPAAELIRKRVEAAYMQEPDAATEAREAQTEPAGSRSRHQRFIYELTNSGKSVPEVQVAWHDYYAGLSDVEKHQVWQEFYSNQAADSSYAAKAAESNELIIPNEAGPQAVKTITATAAGLRDSVRGTVPKRRAIAHSPIRSLVFGLSVGVISVMIVLFGFFNERFIAPFIQPSRSLSNVPLITNAAVGPNPEVIIPKINVQIPVIYGVKSIEESVVQKTLEGGVLHYADTAQPGQNGNAVIVGHSSNNIFNKGKYKFAFVLLSRLEPGDTFYLQKDGQRYTYQVYQKKIVKPDDVSVLGPADRPATASLITCDPPGTSINRLVVTGEQISPDPANNKARGIDNSLAAQSKVIPSNAQSLWSRLWDLLSR
ncbi:MAG: sortase [Candidatus Saccharimonadales bacterium]